MRYTRLRILFHLTQTPNKLNLPVKISTIASCDSLAIFNIQKKFDLQFVDVFKICIPKNIPLFIGVFLYRH